ncbi:hypothetical protein AB1A64_14515 [Ruegeria sp. ANG10]|uniref:hypothetical protein n=1 Tax=Ruegeria sp. ANG10 TaxID=3042467 RepID=UPI003452FB19
MAVNDGKSRQLINAYNGSSYENASSFDFQCNWQTTRYYIEQQSSWPDFGKSYKDQAKFEHGLRSAFAALTIVSKASIRSIPAFKVVKQPKQRGYTCTFSSQRMRPRRLISTDLTFECTTSDIYNLKKIFNFVFERQHPEAYLATLRLMRSINRLQSDDGILDLMIALEAFLNKEKGEKYRLCNRLAHLLHPSDRIQRKKIHDAVESAYSTRSDFVHGGRQETDFLESALGNPHPKNKFADADKLQELRRSMEEIVCAALAERYLTHGDTSREELIKKLDDLSI